MKNNLNIVKGDITKYKADAIVNAANSSLLGGGGVDGAIHRAGGRHILEECIKIRNSQGGCKTGESVITTAGLLDAKFVIHTVGPKYNGGKSNEAEKLRNCYKSVLKLTEEYSIESIAFPCISTGIYKFPKEQAAKIAIDTIEKFSSTNIDITIVCYDDESYNIYKRLLTNSLNSGQNLKLGSQSYKISNFISEGIDQIYIDLDIGENHIDKLVSKFINDANENAIEFARKRYTVLSLSENFEDLLKRNLEFIYKGNLYYTNYQIVVSVIKNTDGLYEVMPLRSYGDFNSMFYLHNEPSLSNPLITKPKGKTCYNERDMHLEVYRLLQKVEVINLPIANSNKSLKIIIYQNSKYEFQNGDYRKLVQAEYDGKWIDSLLQEVIIEQEPMVVKCCINCKMFNFSGMSHSMSGGNVGYCNYLLQESKDEKGTNGKITNITNLCNDYTKK